MKNQEVVLETSNKSAIVKINRPEHLNTLSVLIMKELTNAAVEIGKMKHIRVVVLTGNGGMFSAGLDLKDPEVRSMLAGSAEERRELARLGARLCHTWEKIRAVTIAAIEGFAIGGGVSLVISCDFRIMGRSSFLSIPEVDLGLNYSWGSIPRLTRLVGPSKAKEMTILGERVPSDKCYQWGLLESVAPDGSALEAALSMSRKIIAKPPMPVEMTKLAVNSLFGDLEELSNHMDADQFALTTYTDEHRAGLSAFLEKKGKNR